VSGSVKSGKLRSKPAPLRERRPPTNRTIKLDEMEIYACERLTADVQEGMAELNRLTKDLAEKDEKLGRFFRKIERTYGMKPGALGKTHMIRDGVVMSRVMADPLAQAPVDQVPTPTSTPPDDEKVEAS
jgi:hypothetical protein